MGSSRIVCAVVMALVVATHPRHPIQAAEAAPPTTLSAADREFCVSETNRYRAALGVAPVTASATIEAYADRAAANDHARKRAHDYSRGLNGPKQVAWAENSGIRWPLHDGSTRQAIAGIIAAFWAEGPGGGHYETMRNSRYGAVGCGGYTRKGAFTLVQHFRTAK